MNEISPPDERERVIAVAGKLFSQLGYDITTMQMISDAVGIPMDSVRAVGTKQQIYRSVLKTLRKTENEFLESIGSQIPPGVEGLHVLADAFLEFCLENPELPSLWMHRWLADAADVSDLEESYSVPLLTAMADAVRSVARSEVDAELAAHGAVWLVYGYVHTGLQTGPGASSGPSDPRNLKRFRAYFHSLIEAVV
ncbi:TetR/AcrR family transcriptional regulator [Actinocorallia sp. B10E7]|uniref:TetR/AcrR family transcriptional regulator n=1 Tax=Actinocorallia sp. B10E7 TaxID=3153558 RepID=UPI00325CE68B